MEIFAGLKPFKDNTFKAVETFCAPFCMGKTSSVMHK